MNMNITDLEENTSLEVEAMNALAGGFGCYRPPVCRPRRPNWGRGCCRPVRPPCRRPVRPVCCKPIRPICRW